MVLLGVDLVVGNDQVGVELSDLGVEDLDKGLSQREGVRVTLEEVDSGTENLAGSHRLTLSFVFVAGDLVTERVEFGGNCMKDVDTGPRIGETSDGPPGLRFEVVGVSDEAEDTVGSLDQFHSSHSHNPRPQYSSCG
jgi:hypothetical protein